MLSHCGLVKVLRVKAYMQDTIRLVWIGEGRYPFGRSGDKGNHPLVNHVIKGLLNLFLILDRHLLPGTLYRGNRRVSPDGLGPRHIAYGVKGSGKACFKATTSQTMAVEVKEVIFVNFTLRTGFGLVLGGQEIQVLRAGKGCSCVVGGP